MRATCLVCTLKRSPQESNSESLAQVVLSALRDEGVQTDVIRVADHQIDFGVVSEALSEGDEWPAIRERILTSESSWPAATQGGWKLAPTRVQTQEPDISSSDVAESAAACAARYAWALSIS